MSEGRMVSVSRDVLEKWRRDLDACQKVIWLRGGFDPAYCEDAQDSLKQIDMALAKQIYKHQGAPAGVLTIKVDGSTTSIDYDWHVNVSALPAGQYELHFKKG